RRKTRSLPDPYGTPYSAPEPPPERSTFCYLSLGRLWSRLTPLLDAVRGPHGAPGTAARSTRPIPCETTRRRCNITAIMQPTFAFLSSLASKTLSDLPAGEATLFTGGHYIERSDGPRLDAGTIASFELACRLCCAYRQEATAGLGLLIN